LVKPEPTEVTRFSTGEMPMSSNAVQVRSFANPIHAIFLAFPVALYPSALLTDITYYNTAVIQWTNFSSWLIAGADFFAGLVLAWGLVMVFFGRAQHARGRGFLYLGIVAIMFVLGVWNAFHHARDGWHSVGEFGITLSALCTLLAFVAAFLAYGSTIQTETRT
jgi:uncharacterized membrane protein